jgi:hypothetical protein
MQNDFLSNIIRKKGMKLDERNLLALHEGFQLRIVKKGDYFIREGDASNEIAIVKNGIFCAYYIEKTGAEVIKYFYPEESVLVSYYAYLTGHKSGYYMQALEDSEVYVMKLNDFKQMLQAVLPVMRKSGSGKIINIGSVSGKFAQAINGGYCASKHAVEAMSDALRLELLPFGIQSTVIEPGPIQTNFFQTLAEKSDVILENQDSPYYKFYSSDIRYRKKQPRTDAQKAAQKICDILEKEKLRPRYQVAVPRNIRFLLHLSDGMRERMQMR